MTKARNLAKLISDNIVGTTEIDDDAVTTAKIADSAVTSAKLSVTGGDISYDNSVSGISATSLQGAIDYLNVLSGGGSAGAQATYTREEFTATAGQTTFTTANGYTLGYLQVFMNGILLDSGDYTANDQSTVVLGAGAAVNDEITTVAYDSFAISEVLRVLDISASAPDDSLTIAAGGDVLLGGLTTSTHASSGRSCLQLGATTSTVIGSTIGGTSSTYMYDTGATGAFEINHPNSVFVNADENFRVLTGTSAQERFRIDAAGRVTMPYQPAFIAYDGVGANRSSSGLFSDEFTSTLKNTGNHYNTSTGLFTAPVDGYYLFGWNLFSTVATTTVSRAGMWYNGSTGNSYGFSSGSYVPNTAQGSLLMYMSANDTAGLGTQSSSYTAYWYANQQHCRFWGYLVA